VGPSLARLRLVATALACVALVSCGDDPNDLSGGRGGASSGGSASGGSGGSSGDDGASSSGDPASSSASGGSSGGGDGSAADVCVRAINAHRAEQGLPAFERWTDAEACADGEAKSDGASGQAHGAAFQCGEVAQNECPGGPGPAAQMIPQCLELMWEQGPGEGHHDNMASTRFTKVACGFHTLPDGSVWSVQNFR
jgi:hypothetical protein